MIEIFFNGFWPGFKDRTNPVNEIFFIKLMKEIYNSEIKVGSLEESNILIENTNPGLSYLKHKEWKHTYLFSGESYINNNYKEYSCVLCSSTTKDNMINVPFYIPYIISSFDEKYITDNYTKHIDKVPENDVLVIISNTNGSYRNYFINKLEKAGVKITYAGRYKNNIGGHLKDSFGSKKFLDYVSNFKFIIAMENSYADTYITEKIMHGILGGSIPVYWGSQKVEEYFNKDRILNVNHKDKEDIIIEKIKTMSDKEWLEKVNLKTFTELGTKYNLQEIISSIKKLLNI